MCDNSYILFMCSKMAMILKCKLVFVVLVVALAKVPWFAEAAPRASRVTGVASSATGSVAGRGSSSSRYSPTSFSTASYTPNQSALSSLPDQSSGTGGYSPTYSNGSGGYSSVPLSAGSSNSGYTTPAGGSPTIGSTFPAGSSSYSSPVGGYRETGIGGSPTTYTASSSRGTALSTYGGHTTGTYGGTNSGAVGTYGAAGTGVGGRYAGSGGYSAPSVNSAYGEAGTGSYTGSSRDATVLNSPTGYQTPAAGSTGRDGTVLNGSTGYQIPVAGYAAYSGSTGRRGGFTGTGATPVAPIPSLPSAADIPGSHSVSGYSDAPSYLPASNSAPLPAAAATPTGTSSTAQSVTAERISPTETTAATTAPGDDWLANLFTFNTTVVAAHSSATDFDPVKEANVNCSNAAPFPKSDFLAQSDDTKVYTVPAALPQGSPFASVGFVKFVKVFGIPLLGTVEVGDIQLSHSAKILAAYLDNDNDGVPDDANLLNSLRDTYKLFYGFVGGADESDSFWADRYLNARNAAFREQYVCNIHFFEQWASLVSPRFHVAISQVAANNSTNFYSRCGGISSVPFDWPLHYFLFTIAYYGYLDRLPNDTKASINSTMHKATNAGKFTGQYVGDNEMVMAEFLVWSHLTNSGLLECHCHSVELSEAWNVCTSKELFDFSPDWVKVLDTFDFLPKNLPNGEYPTHAFDGNSSDSQSSFVAEAETSSGSSTPELNPETVSSNLSDVITTGEVSEVTELPINEAVSENNLSDNIPQTVSVNSISQSLEETQSATIVAGDANLDENLEVSRSLSETTTPSPPAIPETQRQSFTTRNVTGVLPVE